MPAKRAPPELPLEDDPAAAARGRTSLSLNWEIESDGSDIDLVEFEPGKYIDRNGVVYERHYCGPPELRDALEAEQRRNSRGPPGDGPAAQPLGPAPPPPPPVGGLAYEARPAQVIAWNDARNAVDILMRDLGVAPVPAPSSGWILMRDPKRLRSEAIAIEIRGDKRSRRSRFHCHSSPRRLRSEVIAIALRLRWGSDWALQEVDLSNDALEAMEERHRWAVEEVD